MTEYSDGPQLDNLIKQCLSDSERWFPNSKVKMWEVGDWDAIALTTLCLMGEGGEVANLVKKVVRGDFDSEMGSADLTEPSAYLAHVERIKEETTDVFVYLLNLFGLLGMDPTAEYEKVRAKNEMRWGTPKTMLHVENPSYEVRTTHPVFGGDGRDHQ